MAPQHIGILHPGEMGISIAAAAQHNGHRVWWVSRGRSAATLKRAMQFDLQDARTLVDLCKRCTLIISICPPAFAESIAADILTCGFRGLFLEANAIAPQRVTRMAEQLTKAGLRFVDGGIIGGPAWEPGRTRLYLSGPWAGELAENFSSGPLAVSVLDAAIGKASALKMCYSAYRKGSIALLCAVLAAAESLGVREALNRHWHEEDKDFDLQASARVQATTDRAWRFVAEMQEIAATFGAVGIPQAFHMAAADIYNRLAHFKTSREKPSLADVLEALCRVQDPMG